MIDDIRPPKHHEHKFFIYQIKSQFEPLPDTYQSGIYKMVEYSYAGCNCGEAIKTIVKLRLEDEQDL